MNNSRIEKFSSDGAFLASVGLYGLADGQFKYPYGIAVDEKDVLYVIDAFNYRIQKFDTDLRFLSKWGDQESIGFKLYSPHEITVLKDGNILMSDRQNHRISIFSKEGKLIKRIGSFGEGAGSRGDQFSEPHGVAVNESGDILVCDRYNFSIHKLSSEGVSLAQWITSGLLDNSNHFPIGIVATKGGSVYITDHYAHCIQKY
jgi:DNA-binding beta-propeller fold protein YncE